MQNKKKDSGKGQRLSRELGLFQLTMMGAGMMIGAGVFVATGIAIGQAGPGGILLAFALNGIIAIFTAMSFAELCSAMPAAGGAYAYVKKAFGGVIGYISGWMNWFALAVAGSLYAITFSEYTLHLLQTFTFFNNLGFNMAVAEKVLAVAIALVFIFINYRGVSGTGKSSTVIALGQTVTLGIIGALGIAVAAVNPERLMNFSPILENGAVGVMIAMGFTYVGFEGFEVIGHAGEEAINPRKNIPKAILYAVIIVVSTYILVAFAAVVGAKTGISSAGNWFAGQGATGFAKAIGALVPFGSVLVVLAAIFSSTSALNATLFSSARVSFAMSRDGYLPPVLSKISKNHVPHIALFASSLIVLVVALLLDVEGVAAAADIMFLLIFLLINLSVIKIRREMSDELHYGFMMPFFPAIPIIALVLQLMLALLLFKMSVLAWVSAGLWIVAGVVIYISYAKNRGEDWAPCITLEEKAADQKKEYQIMLPVQHSTISETLAVYASKIAYSFNAELLLTSIVSLPHYAQREEALQGLEDTRPYIDAVKKRVEGGVPVHSIIGRSETAARGIVYYCKNRKTNMLVLGWKGYTETKGYKMGTTIDRVIEHAPCDRVVIKPGKTGLHTGKRIRRILIPSNGTYHSILASRLALSLLDDCADACITILNINNLGEPEERIRRRLSPMHHVLSECPNKIMIVENENVVDAIAAEAKHHDLVILGANNEGILTQMLFGQVTERIAEKCSNTVMLAKIDLGMRSWISRWIGRRG
jgi:APA family basic amino acid/polyamine antiporter